MGEVHSLLQTLHPQGTVFLFAYPQYILSDGSNITNLIISHSTLPRFLVVNELHLFTHFEKLFQEEFSELNKGLFEHVSVRINLLLITATCTVQIIQSFEELIGMTHTEKHWKSALNMGNQSVYIDVYYKQYPITLLRHAMEEHLHPVFLLGYLIIVYSNERNKI